MQYIVTKNIPKNELKEYKDYIGFLFINENGVYNICNTEEDVFKSNQWFKNMPLETFVVSDEKIDIGDILFPVVTNLELTGKPLKFIGYSKKGEGLIDLQDKEGKKILSTTSILSNSYKFLRIATMDDKKKVVNGNIIAKDVS